MDESSIENTANVLSPLQINSGVVSEDITIFDDKCNEEITNEAPDTLNKSDLSNSEKDGTVNADQLKATEEIINISTSKEFQIQQKIDSSLGVDNDAYKIDTSLGIDLHKIDTSLVDVPKNDAYLGVDVHKNDVSLGVDEDVPKIDTSPDIDVPNGDTNLIVEIPKDDASLNVNQDAPKSDTSIDADVSKNDTSLVVYVSKSDASLGIDAPKTDTNLVVDVPKGDTSQSVDQDASKINTGVGIVVHKNDANLGVDIPKKDTSIDKDHDVPKNTEKGVNNIALKSDMTDKPIAEYDPDKGPIEKEIQEIKAASQKSCKQTKTDLKDTTTEEISCKQPDVSSDKQACSALPQINIEPPKSDELHDKDAAEECKEDKKCYSSLRTHLEQTLDKSWANPDDNELCIYIRVMHF